MSRNERRVELGIVALAIAVRVAAVLILQSHHVPRSTYEHGEIAANLLAGRGFSIRFLGAEGPTSQQMPVYPFLVAACYAVGGVERPLGLLILGLGQSLLGGIMVLGVIRLARLAAGPRPGIARPAGLIAALHPTLVYAATHVQVASLAASLLVWSLAWGQTTAQSGRGVHAGWTGALLALLVLTDPILALAGIGVFGAILFGHTPEAIGPPPNPPPPRGEGSFLPPRSSWGRPGGGGSKGPDVNPGMVGLMRTRSWPDSLRLVTIVVLVAAVGVTPWLVRNALVHGEFVAVKSSFGYAFWQGNCALSEGTDKVVRPSVESALRRGERGEGLSGLNRTLWAARHEAGYLDDIALTPEDRTLLGSVSEPERSRILFRRAIRELASEPGRYPRLCLRRFRYFWLFDETNPKTRVLAYRLSHLGLTAVAILGLILARGDTRARLAPALVTAAAISLFHTLTIVSARFHVPIEPLMAVWAAAGLTRWPGPRPARSTAAGHHVVSIGLERGLGRRERVATLR